jgi:hypothetical protein
MHDLYLAIECRRQPARRGADLGFGELEGVEVSRLIQAAEAHPAYHPEERQRFARLDHIEPELAAVEAVATAYAEQLHTVFVVAHE